jgi:EAL domain-containing protein (putative c-di-GMP-specific phosphodiesterase class I)
LHYQPKISLKTGMIAGAEALLRGTHPVRGPISPARFIPVAEDSGLIVPIGNWVLRAGCRQASAWMKQGLALDNIAVNISAMQFRNEDFFSGVLATLEETGLDPKALELELTESVLLRHTGVTESILEALREHHIQLAIDDFETGYSSLSYLKKFPISELKIDRSFVQQINESQTGIVAAIISMGRSLACAW